MTEPAPYTMWPVAPPPPPPPRRRRRLLPLVIIVASLVVLVGLFAVASSLVNALVHRTASSVVNATGRPGPTAAVSPMPCPEQCFSVAVTSHLVPDFPVLAALGLQSDLYPPGTYDPVTAGEVYRSSLAGWRAVDAGPDVCFFATANSPADAQIAVGQDALDDPVVFVGSWTDSTKDGVVDVAARIFPDTASATAYLSSLATSVGKCSEVHFTSAGTVVSSRVSPEPAFELPDSEAAAGWSRTSSKGPASTTFVTDVQRGNLIVRLRVSARGILPDAKFRSFVSTYAQTVLGPLTVQ